MYRKQIVHTGQQSGILLRTLECILASIIAGVFASLLLIGVVMLLSNIASAATVAADITDHAGPELDRIQHPENVKQVQVEDFDMGKIRRSYIEKAQNVLEGYSLTSEDMMFLAEDSKSTVEMVRKDLKSFNTEH